MPAERGDLERHAQRKWLRGSLGGLVADNLIFFAVLLFLAGGAWLAADNQSWGTWDAKNNLETARNVARGRGFESQIVQQLVVPQPLPNPESIRPLAAPAIAAAAFAVFGERPAIPVLINVLTVAAAALALWYALRAAGAEADFFACSAGALFLFSFRFELVSFWNNNLLVIATCGLLALVSLARGGRLPGHRFALALAVVSAFGFLAKPTFLLSCLPASMIALRMRAAGSRTEAASGGRGWMSGAGWYVGTFALLTSPWWIRNLVLFGSPTGSPWGALRLAVRYPIFEHGPWMTERLGAPPSYAEIVREFGAGWLLKQEVRHAAQMVLWTAIIGGPCLIWGVVLCAINWRSAGRFEKGAICAALCCLIEPFFSAGIYWYLEQRYLWPILPVGLYLTGIGFALTWRQLGELPDEEDGERSWWSDSLIPTIYVGTFVVAGLATVIGGYRTTRLWRAAFREARAPAPEWIEPLKAAAAEGEVVLTDDPPSVAWHCDRPAAIYPLGSAESFRRIAELHQAKFVLYTGRTEEAPEMPPGFAALEAEGGGAGKRRWRIYRIGAPRGP